MLDEETIIATADQLVSEIQRTGLQEGVLRSQHAQDLPLSSQLLQDDLLKAANDLEALTPSIENYDLISRDIQHFTDLQGRKYTLALATGA